MHCSNLLSEASANAPGASKVGVSFIIIDWFFPDALCGLCGPLRVLREISNSRARSSQRTAKLAKALGLWL